MIPNSLDITLRKSIDGIINNEYAQAKDEIEKRNADRNALTLINNTLNAEFTPENEFERREAIFHYLDYYSRGKDAYDRNRSRE